MKNLAKYFIILTFCLSHIGKLSSQTYINDPCLVPVFQGTLGSNPSLKQYWDLNEINNSNNRIDLCVGVYQTGGSGNNYTNGNWYKNEYDSNFNSEDVNTRFIYQNGSVNGITGVFFVQINGNEPRRSLVTCRQNGLMESFNNSDGSITPSGSFSSTGRIAAIGKFTTDTLDDVAVISGSDLLIYKGNGDGKLDSNSVLLLEDVNADNVFLVQISTRIYPYYIIDGTKNDRDEIIVVSGTTAKIFYNDNYNGISDTASVTVGTSLFTEMKFDDIDRDGYNDLLYGGQNFGIKIFRNVSGSLASTPYYTNTNYPWVSGISSGDFNKDGWNDLAVSNINYVYIFIKANGTFPQTATSSTAHLIPEYVATKTAVADLHNQGGLSVIISGVDSGPDPDPEELYYSFTKEQMTRFNAAVHDAVPAPAKIFAQLDNDNGIYRPRLRFFNAGEKDFLKYKIYKKKVNTDTSFALIDSTSNDYYVDHTEEVYVYNGDPEEPPIDMCNYYVIVEDNSHKLSISSDTVTYQTLECLYSCGESGISRGHQGIEMPDKVSVTNYPNPFNPVSKIYYIIPHDANVKITVYNSIGQMVAELVNEFKRTGSYKAVFNRSNFASGVYYYRIEAGNFTAVKKMMMVK